MVCWYGVVRGRGAIKGCIDRSRSKALNHHLDIIIIISEVQFGIELSTEFSKSSSKGSTIELYHTKRKKVKYIKQQLFRPLF